MILVEIPLSIKRILEQFTNNQFTLVKFNLSILLTSSLKCNLANDQFKTRKLLVPWFGCRVCYDMTQQQQLQYVLVKHVIMACNYILTCELSHTSSIFERRQIIFVEFAHDICVLVVLLRKFCQVIINGDQRNT